MELYGFKVIFKILLVPGDDSPDGKFALKFVEGLHTTTSDGLNVKFFVEAYLQSRSGGIFENLTSVLTDEGRCLGFKNR